MKKTILSLSVLCLIVFIFYACTKNSHPDKLDLQDPMISTQQARVWFEQQIAPSGSGSILSSAPNKHFTTVQWDKAVLKTGHNKVKFWKVPLASQDSARILFQFLDPVTKKVSKSLLSPPSLLIYQDSSGRFKVLVMQVVPRSILPAAGKLSANGSKFSGEVRMYNWTGTLQYGYVYQNGQKEKKISPVRKDQPLARYEEMCIEYKRCLWGAICYRPGGTDGYVFVSTVTTTEGGVMCYPPNEPPFSGNYAETCGSWINEGEENYEECTMVWVDDPVIDPDPPPYEPDVTVGYGVQSITNLITEPCQWWVAQELMTMRKQSEIVDMAHDIFGTSAKVNLTYKDKSAYFIDHPGKTFPDDVAGRTTRAVSGGTLNISIYLNTDVLGLASREYIAATLLHELMHGILNDGTASYEHNSMVEDYIDEMDALLIDAYPNLSAYDARALNIEGLSDSILGSVLASIFTTGWNNYINTAHEYLNGTKGTSCY